MTWRRGLLLAGINFTVAAISFVQLEAVTWHWTRSGSIAPTTAHAELAAFQDEPVWSSNPCDFGIWDNGYSPLSLVAGAASLPVSLATGWHTPCNPNRSVFTRQVDAAFGRNTRRSEVVAVVCLCLLVFVLWGLVGGLPLARSSRWWLDPGAAITLCTLVGFLLALVPYTSEWCRLTASAACLGWVWWLGLLLWKPAHHAWRSTLGGLRRLIS